jgi:hypothetical protein
VTIRIGNVKNGDSGEYVGRVMPGRRASPLGNPFYMGDEGDRAGVICAYRTWLDSMLRTVGQTGRQMQAELKRLRALAERPEGVTLLCWCAPLPCHAEVIRENLLGSAT